jgi:GH15 family glucan-1,4-alpha-glucosidase
VEGLTGNVPMQMRLLPRFDYGSLAPWLEPCPDGIIALAGPNALHLSTSIGVVCKDAAALAEFGISEGARERFSLGWYPSYADAPAVEDSDSALARTEPWWREWSSRCSYSGARRDTVLRSMITLKALTDRTTGAVIAATGTTAIAGCATRR